MSSPTADKALVLVVEDEAVLRFWAVDVVEQAGFEAIEAANADDAIAILEARQDIRLIFTDIDMPGGMDGLRLAACVRDRWPPIEIIVTSGKSLPADFVLPSRAIFIPKPFDVGRLIASLKQLAG